MKLSVNLYTGAVQRSIKCGSQPTKLTNVRINQRHASLAVTIDLVSMMIVAQETVQTAHHALKALAREKMIS